jgi:arylsulfatase A-like enzyme
LQPKILQQLSLEEVTLAKRLKAAGYATACIGKWHLGGQGFSPKEQGFDVYHAGVANTTPSAGEGGKGEYDLTTQAIEFINANKEKPFFLYLAHNNPHIPLSAKHEAIEKYSHTFNPTYAAAVNTLDDSIGLILSTLDRQKLKEKTIVIFTSDNGGLHVPEGVDDAPTHNTPYRAGKGFLYEGGLRVPLIVRFPGTVPLGKESNVPIISTDWTPTLLSLCGLSTSDKFDGHDMSKVLQGGKGPERELYWHFPHYTNQGGRPGGALRDGDFKFIEHYEDQSVELYNLGLDPSESRNLARTLAGITEAYRINLADWRKSVAAQENEKNPNFDAAAHKKLYLDMDASRVKVEKNAKATSEPLREWRKLMNEVVPKK